MTRMPDRSSTGPSAAAAVSGTARNAISDVSMICATSSGTTGLSQMRASAGSGRGAVLEAEDIATASVAEGWRASKRTSSWPANPVAPTTARRSPTIGTDWPFGMGLGPVDGTGTAIMVVYTLERIFIHHVGHWRQQRAG